MEQNDQNSSTVMELFSHSVESGHPILIAVKVFDQNSVSRRVRHATSNTEDCLPVVNIQHTNHLNFPFLTTTKLGTQEAVGMGNDRSILDGNFFPHSQVKSNIIL